MTARAMQVTLLALGPILLGCERAMLPADSPGPRSPGIGSQALLVAELEARLGDRFAADARAGLDKMELCLKRFAHGREASNAGGLVSQLEREHSALLEVLQAEELHGLGVDLINSQGRAVERLELEIEYQAGRLEYAWDADALEVLRRYAVRPGLRAELWALSDNPPRGWTPHTPPPLAEGARQVHLGEVLQRGRLRVRMGLTSAGRAVPEG
jgi:hypothetical protein